MYTVLTPELLEELRSVKWEESARRPGFLQSKAIVMEAEIQPLPLTKSVTLKYANTLWVDDMYLIDAGAVETFQSEFDRAFAEDQDWPLKIIEQFAALTKEKDAFVQDAITLAKTGTRDKRIEFFKRYKSLLIQIQKYYVFAMPLTNYCERELQKTRPELLQWAYPYQELDVDLLNASIRALQNMKNDGSLTEHMIAEHLAKFAWIKSAYNIIGHYSRADLDAEIIAEIASSELPEISEQHFLLTALRVGIYGRNRIKELSQQVWCAFDPVAQSLAHELQVDIKTFYTLTCEEVLAGFAGGTLPSEETVDNRARGFAQGYVNDKAILLVDEDLKAVADALLGAKQKDLSEIKGQIACKGKVTGHVKVIRSHSDFAKMTQGDILVTAMTTPDFMVIIKKSAAIVTDEGGLSCHAAIVSREFKIPCVMGTKIATTVFKDGDFVEVDADHGVVRKI